MGATVFVQPLDLVKTRLQISGQGGTAKEYTGTFDVGSFLNSCDIVL
jgi:solute carrier family 25 (mitochondrial oxoglutarate transporter), member 11